MAIFPELTTASLPLLRELSFDYKTHTVRYDDEGRPLYDTGIAALRTWIYKALHLEAIRFLFCAYTDRYGNEFASLVGRPFSDARLLLPQMVRECLLVNPYILSIDDVSIEQNEQLLTLHFTVHSVYGSFQFTSEEWSL